MGIRVECDWCRETIGTGESYVTLGIDGKVDGVDIGGPARVFCGGHGGTGRQCCGSRLLALLDGNPGGRVDMGMEWQLVDVGDVAESEDGRRSAPAPRPVGRLNDESTSPGDRVLYDVLPHPDGRNASYRVRWGCCMFLPNNLYAGTLHRAGISTVDDLRRACEDGSIFELPGVGPKTAARIADVIARFAPVEGVPA